MTFGILKRELDDIVTLTEVELEEGVRLALRATHNLAEGAGAASLAAAMKLRDQLQGKKVVAVMSGGNITIEVDEAHSRRPLARRRECYSAPLFTGDTHDVQIRC